MATPSKEGLLVDFRAKSTIKKWEPGNRLDSLDYDDTDT